MGEKTHYVDKEQGICRACGVETVVRQNRQVCPIAWREQHGQRRIKLGEEGGPKTRKRKVHVLTADQGVVTCKCGIRAIQLVNGSWVCPTQKDQAVRGIKRQEAIWGPRVNEVVPEVADADLGLAATVATRQYRTLSGRHKGGEPAPTDGASGDAEGDSAEGTAEAQGASGPGPEVHDGRVLSGSAPSRTVRPRVSRKKVASGGTSGVVVRDLRGAATSGSTRSKGVQK